MEERGRVGGQRAARVRLVVVVVIAAAVIVGVANRDDSGSAASPASEGRESTTTGQESTTTAALAAPAVGPDQTTLDTIAIGLTPVVSVEHPTSAVQRPGTDDLYVTSFEGKLLRVPVGGGPAEELADLGERISNEDESGLLDLAFDLSGDRLFLSLVERAGNLAVYEVPMAGPAPAFDRQRLVIAVDSPSTVHHAGDVYVDPAGLLWLAVGDGGPNQAASRRGQDLLDLHGKILRLDPSHPSDGRAYGIRPTTRSSGGPTRPPRSGRTGCATRGGSSSTSRPARCGSETSDVVRSRRSITSPGPRGVPVSTSAGRTSRARRRWSPGRPPISSRRSSREGTATVAR